MIHKIETKEEKLRTLRDFDNWWGGGGNIE
jgi:hypothetical protein